MAVVATATIDADYGTVSYGASPKWFVVSFLGTLAALSFVVAGVVLESTVTIIAGLVGGGTAWIPVDLLENAIYRRRRHGRRR